ncbi:MAG: hypothetical protein JWP08_1087 [Bryobacterales bacterium]|nr:hypothetical protein [Bryobacterales bacterium]
MNTRFAAFLAVSAALSLPQLLAAAPLDAVLAALAAEERAPSERVHLRFEREGIADVYLIDRIKFGAGPARIHMVKNPGPAQQELIAVDGVQWLRTATGWERSPATQATTVGASMIGVFRNGMTEVVENTPVGSGDQRKRRFSGRISWANGVTQHSGRIALSVDKKGRPSAIAFDGQCGTRPCRFQQLFDYDATFTIEPPKL